MLVPIRLALLALTLLMPAWALADGESFESGERGVVLGPFEGLPSTYEVLPEQEAAFARAMGTLQAGEDAIAGEAFERLYEKTGWPELAYNAGLCWYREGRYDRGLRFAQAAGEALPSDLRVGYLRGVLLQTVGRYRDAKDLMERSLAYAEEIGEPFFIAVAHLNSGASSRLLGAPEEALDSFVRAEKLGVRAGMPGVAAAAWMGRGRVLLSLGDRKGAEEAFGRARKLGRKSGFESAEVDSVLSQASLALAGGQNEKAGRLLEKALTAARGITDRSVRASLLLTAAELRRNQGRSSESVLLLKEAEDLFASSGVEVGVAHCAQLRGAWAREAGNLEEAERELARSLEIQGRFQVPLAEADGWRHQGLLRADQGQFSVGEGLVRRAIEVFVAARAAELERGAQVALADVLWRSGKLSSAIAAALRALALAELSGDARAQHQIQVELGILYAAAGDLDRAEEFFGRVTPSAKSKLSPGRRGRYWVQLASSLRGAGRAEEALAAAQRGFEFATTAGDSELLRHAQQSLALALADLGRSVEAVEFLEEQGVGEGELLETIHSSRTIAIYNEGVRALQAQDYPRAVERFEILMRDPRVDDDRRQTAEKSLQSTLGLYGQAQRAEGHLEASQSLYERALAIAESRGDVTGRVSLLLRLALIRTEVGDPVGAGEQALRAAELAGQGGELRLAGEAWTVLGDLRFDSDTAGAREAYRAALRSWADDASVLARRANVTYNLAALDAHDGDVVAARAGFAAARVLALKVGDKGLVARVDEVLVRLESE